MTVKLRIIGDGEERFHDVHPHESVVVFGRHSSCDVVLDSEKRASRRHCQIEKQADGTYVLRDLQSANGTMANGLIVTAHRLALGDKIAIGDTTIFFGEPAPVRKVSPPASASPRRSDRRAAVSGAARNAKAVNDLVNDGALTNPNFVKNVIIASVVVFIVGIVGLVVMKSINGPAEVDPNLSANSDEQLELQRAKNSREEALAEFRKITNSTASLLKQLQDVRAFSRANALQPFGADVRKWEQKFCEDLGDRLVERLDATVRQQVMPECNNHRYGHAMEIMSGFLKEHQHPEFEKFTAWCDKWEEEAQAIRTKADTFLEGTLVYEALDLMNIGMEKGDMELLKTAKDIYVTAQRQHFRGMDEQVNKCKDRADAIGGIILARERGAQADQEVINRARDTRRARVERNEYPKPVEPGPTTAKPETPQGNPGQAMSRSREQELVAALHETFLKAANRGGDRKLTEYYLVHNGERRPMAGADRNKGLALMLHGTQVYIAWDKVQKETLLACYMLISGRTVDENWAIAIFAFGMDNRPLAEAVLYDMLQKDASLKADIDAFLGKKRGIDVPDGGFIAYKVRGKDGVFLTPAEKEAIDIAERVEGLMDTIEKNISSNSESRKTEMLDAIKELQKYGADARRQALDLINARKEKERKKLETMGFGGNSQLDQLKKELDDARADALKKIFDKAVYPDENHGAVGQPVVDEAVNKVKQIWANPAGAIGRIDPGVAKVVEKIKSLIDLAKQVDPDNQVLSGKEEEEFLNWVNSLANKKLNIQNYSPNGGERQLYADNDQIERDNNLGDSTATPSERQHVSIVNAYRNMMGYRALRINSKLCDASRAHSNYLKSSNQFAHSVPGHPDGQEPSDRARKYGYPRGVGENIAMSGRGHTPQSSFDAWYNSSGHHRNMLNPQWRVMGVGDGGSHWTQMFGGAEDGSEPREPGRR